MKKKLFLTLIFITFLISCGKKSDPEYKGSLDITITLKPASAAA